MVCVPSVETANEVSMLLGLSNDKLKVLGAGIRFNEAITSEKDTHLLDFKYFIFLGGFNSRKNRMEIMKYQFPIAFMFLNIK
jgi:hypothetical protein